MLMSQNKINLSFEIFLNLNKIYDLNQVDSLN